MMVIGLEAENRSVAAMGDLVVEVGKRGFEELELCKSKKLHAYLNSVDD